MRKKGWMTMLAGFACLTMTVSAFGAVEVKRLLEAEDLDEYVTLGEYKGLKLEAADSDVTDDQVDYEISLELQEMQEEVKDGTVQEGDTAYIDYVGKKDDVAFEGGTADNYPLVIGSGTFIPGFEDGVIGMAVGETKDIPLTFPEEYHNADLAGADVVFTVTLNKIERKPELTDDWVKDNTDFQTVDEYKDSVRTRLAEEQAASAENTLKQEAFYQVWVTTEIKGYPEEEVEKKMNYMIDQVKVYAEQEGNMTLEEFLETQGETLDQFNEEARQYAQQRIAQDMIVQAIIDEEEIPMDDDAIQEIAQTLLDTYGYDDIDQMIEYYGESEVYATIALIRVEDFLVENAEITEPAEEPEVEEVEETEEETEEAAGEETEEAAEETTEEEVPEAAEEEAEEKAE